MNTPLSRVLAKIAEIAEKSDDGDYIYRGESQCHDEVSSNLYREYKEDIQAENFDIEIVQNEILREAKEYTTHKMDDFEILTELQHYGGKTNLIDFTTDSLVALFFACDGNQDASGRVILLQQQSEAYTVVRPPRTIPRVGVQKSIFVQAPGGVVASASVVCIPVDLKGDMLDYLRKHHDISTKTIYNDLLGFIEKRSVHKSAYTEFYKGLTCQIRAASTKNPSEKQTAYDKAVVHYTEAIALNPEYARAYNNRGIVYGAKGEVDKALQDCNKVIELNPENAGVYYNRGIAYADKGEVGKALQDYTKAIDLNPEYAAAYNNRCVAYAGKGEVERALQDYNTAIELNPENAQAYSNRGSAYADKGEVDRALVDFNTAIDLNPKLANAYYNRGRAWLHLREWGNAKANLSTAKNMEFNIIASFHNDYRSIEAFEAKHDVKVPEDIAALLK